MSIIGFIFFLLEATGRIANPSFLILELLTLAVLTHEIRIPNIILRQKAPAVTSMSLILLACMFFLTLATPSYPKWPLSGFGIVVIIFAVSSAIVTLVHLSTRVAFDPGTYLGGSLDSLTSSWKKEDPDFDRKRLAVLWGLFESDQSLWARLSCLVLPTLVIYVCVLTLAAISALLFINLPLSVGLFVVLISSAILTVSRRMARSISFPIKMWKEKERLEESSLKVILKSFNSPYGLAHFWIMSVTSMSTAAMIFVMVTLVSSIANAIVSGSAQLVDLAVPALFVVLFIVGGAPWFVYLPYVFLSLLRQWSSNQVRLPPHPIVSVAISTFAFLWMLTHMYSYLPTIRIYDVNLTIFLPMLVVMAWFWAVAILTRKGRSTVIASESIFKVWLVMLCSVAIVSATSSLEYLVLMSLASYLYYSAFHFFRNVRSAPTRSILSDNKKLKSVILLISSFLFSGTYLLLTETVLWPLIMVIAAVILLCIALSSSHNREIMGKFLFGMKEYYVGSRYEEHRNMTRNAVRILWRNVWIAHLVTATIVLALLRQQVQLFAMTLSVANLLALEALLLGMALTCLFGRKRTGMTSARLANTISSAPFPEDSIPPVGLLNEIGHYYNVSNFRLSLALSIAMLALGQALIGASLLERLAIRLIGLTHQEAFLGMSLAVIGLIGAVLSTVLYKWTTRGLQ